MADILILFKSLEIKNIYYDLILEIIIGSSSRTHNNNSFYGRESCYFYPFVFLRNSVYQLEIL